nr:hypothetical protein CFP56_70110 [Quercus suber]
MVIRRPIKRLLLFVIARSGTRRTLNCASLNDKVLNGLRSSGRDVGDQRSGPSGRVLGAISSLSQSTLDERPCMHLQHIPYMSGVIVLSVTLLPRPWSLRTENSDHPLTEHMVSADDEIYHTVPGQRRKHRIAQRRVRWLGFPEKVIGPKTDCDVHRESERQIALQSRDTFADANAESQSPSDGTFLIRRSVAHLQRAWRRKQKSFRPKVIVILVRYTPVHSRLSTPALNRYPTRSSSAIPEPSNVLRSSLFWIGNDKLSSGIAALLLAVTLHLNQLGPVETSTPVPLATWQIALQSRDTFADANAESQSPSDGTFLIRRSVAHLQRAWRRKQKSFRPKVIVILVRYTPVHSRLSTPALNRYPTRSSSAIPEPSNVLRSSLFWIGNDKLSSGC